MNIAVIPSATVHIKIANGISEHIVITSRGVERSVVRLMRQLLAKIGRHFSAVDEQASIA